MNLAAIVLAAGRSSRMGRPKMVMPWGETSVIGQVVATLAAAGVGEIWVVTGGARAEVEAALAGSPARTVFNPRYAEDNMVLSLQTGLAAVSEACAACLVALGDQPQIQAATVRAVAAAYAAGAGPLVAPSYHLRRGHPWLMDRSLWPAVHNLAPGQTLRDLLQAYGGCIHYVSIDNDTILRDLDTPEDWERERGKLNEG